MHKASTSGSTGQAFASSSWLTNHYLSKSPQLIRHITSLPIYPGDRVLDLGCGIGFYMEHFLQMVGSSGEVVGIDHDPELTAIARETLQKSFFYNWDIATADLFDSAIDFSRFNKVVLFNGLSYQKDLLSRIAFLYERLSVGSLLIIKDFDMATSIYSPIDKRLHGELVEAVRKEISVNPDSSINKFVGSALHGLSRKITGGKSISSIWSYIHTHPFSAHQIEFMTETNTNSISMASAHCSEEVTCYFRSQFLGDDASFYKSQASSFIENEHLVIMPA